MKNSTIAFFLEAPCCGNEQIFESRKPSFDGLRVPPGVLNFRERSRELGNIKIG